MFDGVWGGVLTCSVHMSPGNMRSVEAHNSTGADMWAMRGSDY